MYSYGNYLEHYGIKGQKWGVRNYQNEDGTLTKEGIVRYNKGQARASFGVRMKNAANKTGQFVKKQVQRKIDERRGKSPAAGMTDDELNQRLQRMRKEAEYTRLQREIQGTNQNQGGKKGGGGKKHPYLALAVLTPVATAIGVGTKLVTKEKVTKFLENRANKKLSSLEAAKAAGRSKDVLKKMYNDTMKAFESAVESGKK